ncbi:MAG: DUF1501 domain-containing protein, partial [Myxococcales bacterium]
RMQRRTFLQAATAAGLGAGLASRRAFGSSDLPELVLPSSARAFNILECFLYGGLSTWETFYGVEEYGRPDNANPQLQNTQFYAFNNGSNTALQTALQRCGDAALTLTPFATDANGMKVKLGPMLRPLLARKDITDRMRVVVTRHDLEPHEAAIPLALCGRTLGSPSMASLGAHASRHFLEKGDAGRRSPYAYAFATSFIPSDNVLATVATGTLPGSSRPLMIKVDGAAQLTALLERNGVGTVDQRKQHDALLETYINQHRQRLRWQGKGDPLRSPKLAEMAQAVRAVRDVDGVQSVLKPELFLPFASKACTDEATNLPGMSLRLAAHLLTHPTEPARHCCVVDGGLLPADGGGGYDTHGENSYTQSRNLSNLFGSLLPLINEPGENDPSKIDLNKTMIVLNMEFGRSPQAQGGEGRNHWPYGYTTVYLGGPITEAQRGLHGAIGPDGYATTYVTPAEHRMAALMALGIWPFFQDSFGVSDVQNVAGELEGAQSVAARVLGYSS